MFNKKTALTMLVVTLIVSNAFAENDGLPPKRDPSGMVDCGAKTATELDRKLEKTGPEVSMDRTDTPGQSKTTLGILGSTASFGSDVSDEKLKTMVIGQTKYQDVVTMFGKPTSVIRTDDVFVAMYSFSRMERKVDPISFIPIFGSLFAKSKTNAVTRRVDIRFTPDDGLLISCAKTDNLINQEDPSMLEMIKGTKVN